MTGNARGVEPGDLIGWNFSNRLADEIGSFGPTAPEGEGDVMLSNTASASDSGRRITRNFGTKWIVRVFRFHLSRISPAIHHKCCFPSDLIWGGTRSDRLKATRPLVLES